MSEACQATSPRARRAIQGRLGKELAQSCGLALVIGAYMAPILWHNGLPILVGGDLLRLFYEALLSSRGFAIYKDFFEFVEPGSIWLLSAWAHIFGFSISSLNAWLMTSTVAIALVLFWTTRGFLGFWWSATAVAWASYCTIYPGMVPYHRLAAILCVVAACVTDAKRPQPAYSLIAGFCGGCACLMAQSDGGLGTIAIAVWLWVSGRWRRSLVFLAGAALPLFVAGLYFAARSSLREYMHFTILFALFQVPRGPWSGAAAWPESWHAVLMRPDTGRRIFEISVAIITAFVVPFSNLAVLVYSRTPRRLRILAIVAASQLAAVGFGPSLSRVGTAALIGFPSVFWWISRTRLAKVWFAIAILLVAAGMIRRDVRRQMQDFTIATDRVAGDRFLIASELQLAPKLSSLQSRTRPGDVVGLYPSETDLLFLADVRNPGRFFWVDEGGFTSRAEVQQTVDAIRLAAPEVAMWSRVFNEAGDEVRLDYLLPLERYIAHCYASIDGTIEAIRIRRSEVSDCGTMN